MIKYQHGMFNTRDLNKGAVERLGKAFEDLGCHRYINRISIAIEPDQIEEESLTLDNSLASKTGRVVWTKRDEGPHLVQLLEGQHRKAAAMEMYSRRKAELERVQKARKQRANAASMPSGAMTTKELEFEESILKAQVEESTLWLAAFYRKGALLQLLLRFHG
jgi:hypothetical protein